MISLINSLILTITGAEDSHWSLHLATVILKISLNLPLTYPHALFYVYIRISPYPFPYVEIATRSHNPGPLPERGEKG